MTIREKKISQKIALLSVSLPIVSSGAIAGNIPAISLANPTVNNILIETVVTLPSFFVILTVLLSPGLAKRFGYKATVMMGIALVFLTGIIPVFFSSFWILFATRIFFGIGIGVVNPLLYSFAGGMFQGRELAAVIGFQSAFEGVGGMLTTFLVGQLMVFGWQKSFMVYGIALPILLLFWFYVPDITVEQSTKSPQKSVRSEKQGDSFAMLVVLLLVSVIIYMSLSVKISGYLQYRGLGDGTDASNFLALVGAGAMTAGFTFGRLFAVLRKQIVVVAFSGMAMSLLLLAYGNHLWQMMLAGAAAGFSFRLFVPYALNQVNQEMKNKEGKTALLLVTFNLGAALTPLVIGTLQRLFPSLIQADLFVKEALVMIGLAVLLSLKRLSLFQRKDQEEMKEEIEET